MVLGKYGVKGRNETAMLLAGYSLSGYLVMHNRMQTSCAQPYSCFWVTMGSHWCQVVDSQQSATTILLHVREQHVKESCVEKQGRNSVDAEFLLQLPQK